MKICFSQLTKAIRTSVTFTSRAALLHKTFDSCHLYFAGTRAINYNLVIFSLSFLSFFVNWTKDFFIYSQTATLVVSRVDTYLAFFSAIPRDLHIFLTRSFHIFVCFLFFSFHELQQKVTWRGVNRRRRWHFFFIFLFF